MKEQLEPQTDPILEECYRMKAEFAAQFSSIEELYDYLNATIQDYRRKTHRWLCYLSAWLERCRYDKVIHTKKALRT